MSDAKQTFYRIELYPMVQNTFVGPIKIQDHEMTPKYRRFCATYKCIRCGGQGAQVVTDWRDKTGKFVQLSDKQVEDAIREKVKVNHQCQSLFKKILTH